MPNVNSRTGRDRGRQVRHHRPDAIVGGHPQHRREAIFRAPWVVYVPGFAIFVAITACGLVGEALRDAADPRLDGGR